MNVEEVPIATPEGLRRFVALNREAVDTVVGRFDQFPSTSIAMFGERGRAACREDIGYHLEFLRPVLEFGILQPFLDYVKWLSTLLATRGVPPSHLALSLEWLLDFYADRLTDDDLGPIKTALNAGLAALRDPIDILRYYERLMPAACGECDDFQAALLRGDQRTSLKIFREVANEGEAFLDAELHLVQPAMYGIGKGWHENRVSVAQEHLATAMVQGLLAREFATAKPEPANGRTVVLAGVEGNHHVIGLRMVADAFELAGWDVRYLGANTPAGSLLQLVRDDRPNLVGLSVAMPQHLRKAREAIQMLHTELADACPAVMLGGLMINQFSSAAPVLGADATAPNARLAVSAADRLVVCS